MRKLYRDSVEPPACLSRFRPGTDPWEKLSKSQARAEVLAHLEKLQGRRCAYCEGPLDKLGEHVEHFRPRGYHRFVHLTFEWRNLFWSCDQLDSCGRHKDADKVRRTYDLDAIFDVILDPSRDDPDDYFHFLPDGTIQVRESLSEKQKSRAFETLRIFNLDADFGRLRSMRQRAVEAYRAASFGIEEELKALSREDREAFIREEVSSTAGDPFSTTIRHLFRGL